MENENKTKKNKTGIIVALVALVIIILVAAIIFFATRNKGYRSITLKEYEGTVEVKRGDEALEIFKDLWFKSGDEASTGDDSWMALEIDLDKHLMVNPNTVFDIVATGTEEKGEINIELQQGKALVKIDNKLNDDSTFEVTTPNATMSVRGTTFTSSYDPAENESHVYVNGGCVKVESNDGQTIELNAGDSATVKDDSITQNDVYLLYIPRHYYWDDPDYMNNIEHLRNEVSIMGRREETLSFIDDVPAGIEPIVASHYSDLDDIYTESVEKFETVVMDVNDWFPEYVTMDIGYGTKTYRIEYADTCMSTSYLENVSHDNIYLPHNDEGLYYVGMSVRIYVTEAEDATNLTE